jgi:hypothetical protein
MRAINIIRSFRRRPRSGRLVYHHVDGAACQGASCMRPMFVPFIEGPLSSQEMAERRHRQVAADRRLISDRTAKGLRTLAAPQRVYRDRGMRGLASRRSLNLTDYLVVPPEEMELDDDNDSLESAVEGARINYDLYDAYTNRTGLCTSFLPLLVPPSQVALNFHTATEPHLSPPPPHLRHVLRSTRRESWGTTT